MDLKAYGSMKQSTKQPTNYFCVIINKAYGSDQHTDYPDCRKHILMYVVRLASNVRDLTFQRFEFEYPWG